MIAGKVLDKSLPIFEHAGQARQFPLWSRNVLSAMVWQGFRMWKVWLRVVFVYVGLMMYSMYIKRNTLLLHTVQVGRTGVARGRRQCGCTRSSFYTNLIVNHTAQSTA